jgi:hydrogenase maturation protease
MRDALPDAHGRSPLTGAGTGVVILGAGNELRGDDAAGLEVIRLIRSRALPPGVVAREQPGDLLGLLDAWAGCWAAVVVDAMQSAGAAPGAVLRLDVSGAPLTERALGRASTHAAGIGDAIELARTLGRLPERVIVYAVPGTRFELGAGLSPAVRAALPALADTVVSEARRLAARRP